MHIPPNVSKEKLVSDVADHVAIVDALKKKNLPEMLRKISMGLV